jgi:hypothetical protein
VALVQAGERGRQVTPGKWQDIAQGLNKITQLASDSANAAKIARKVVHIKRLLKGERTGQRGRLARVTFDTTCACGREMNVTVTKGKPFTFRVNEGGHACRFWPAACKLIIDRARREK